MNQPPAPGPTRNEIARQKLDQRADGQHPAAVGALVLGAIAILAGIIVGYAVPGAQVGGYGSTETSFTIGTSGDGGFNWLLFSIFAGAALICAAVGMGTMAIEDAIRRHNRRP